MTNRTDLQIKSKDILTGKNITTTISYVNPNATNQQLIQLATALNNLTTNDKVQYIKSSKEVLA